MLNISSKITAQQLHHHLMLILAIPILIWVVSGCYFVWLDLGYIRSDHYQSSSPVALQSNTIHFSISDVIVAYPTVQQIKLSNIANQPFYTIDNTILINANTLQKIERITQQQAIDIALSNVPKAKVKPSIKAIKTNAPEELSARHLPVWQVSFDNAVNTTIYVSMKTGDIVTRRHDFWRIFDFFWRLHIMDYDDGADIDNTLLFITSLLTIIAVLSGIAVQLKRLKRGRV